MIHVKKKTNMMVLIIFYLYIGTFCGIRDTEGLHCTERWFLNHSEKGKFHLGCPVFKIYAKSLISSTFNVCTHFFMLESVTKLSQHFVEHIQTLCCYSDAYRRATLVECLL